VALHGLLIAAAAMLGVAGWVKVAAGVAVVAHGWRRWPAAAPTPILVAEDGSCCIPSLDTGWLSPGPRTLLAAYWLRLSLVGDLATHDILLCMDQVEAATWARLNARLRRGRPPGTAAAQAAQRTGQPDLR
jgi:hypothetical protein